MISVYTASKLHHAMLWKALRIEWPDVNWTARWPIQFAGIVEDTPENAGDFWAIDLADVIASDVVMVYGEPSEILRGALVEAGMGLALGKKILCVGQNESFGTWQYHKLCTRVARLEEAYEQLIEWSRQTAQLELW